MSFNHFPAEAKVSLEWGDIFRKKESPSLTERASSRMVKIAAHLPEGEFVGWQMDVPVKGLTSFAIFGTAAVQASDLLWITEETAKVKADTPSLKPDAVSHEGRSIWNLYEILIPVEKAERRSSIGFNIPQAENIDKSDASASSPLWPRYFSKEFGELIKVLRTEGAAMRYAVGRATVDEQSRCKKSVLSTWHIGNLDVSDYIGSPVRVKILLLLPAQPSVRLKAILHEYAASAELSLIGNMGDEACRHIWDNPMTMPQILPDYAARIMAMEPQVGETPIIGISSCEEEPKPLPAGHQEPSDSKALCIGTAMGTTGLDRNIHISDIDARRHWQIIGQTGTGKSTLIACSMLESIKKGHGVTFFDPHGTTIDMILQSLPKEHAGRVRVVHLGDADNPIPISIWDTDDHNEAEKTISDLNMLFFEIFDPGQNGFLGPRWERWFSLFASAAIALLGRQASFDSIVTLSQNRDAMTKLVKAISLKDPRLSTAIQSEFVDNRSNDFAEIISWCVCKMQRLASIPQLRNTLGAGADALNFNDAVDNDTVTLIDLALPSLGAHASRVLGTLLMLKLWNAILTRKCRDKTHFFAIDEAHLFQTNPLPQMLAEGRKFGLSMILAHQHCGQLSQNVRDSLEANSANFSAFCLSRKDAIGAVDRLGDPELFTDLCRQNVFSAITTLSISGRQTPAFTLQIKRPKANRAGKAVADEIRKNSIKTLVEPYRNARALSSDEVYKILKMSANYPPSPPQKKVFLEKLSKIVNSQPA